jgi:thiamine-phosphate pyrophosphorylase
MNRTLSKTAANLKRHTIHGRRADICALWLMSDEQRIADPTDALLTLPRGSGVIFRHYRAKNRTALAQSLSDICRRRGLVFVVACRAAHDWRLAVEVKAEGLHFTGRAARQGPAPGARLWLRERNGRTTTRRLATFAAHNIRELRRAGALKASAALLSPIFPTASHPDQPALGPIRAARMIRMTSVPVLALGGVTIETIGRLSRTGCVGVAGIGFALSKDAT